jgi:hypothetical protein
MPTPQLTGRITRATLAPCARAVVAAAQTPTGLQDVDEVMIGAGAWWQ